MDKTPEKIFAETPGLPSILVVDDEQRIRDACRMILADDGFDVALAPDGECGLKMIAAHHFDIIVPDTLLQLRRQPLYFLDKDLDQFVIHLVGGHHILIPLIRQAGNQFCNPLQISGYIRHYRLQNDGIHSLNKETITALPA